MKQRMIYAALAVLAFSVPAGAEPIRLAQASEAGTLPPHEILTILRSTGLDPLGQPVRRGPNYVLRAVDDSDREVSVVVSARSGAVLSVTAVATPSRAPLGPPPRGGVSMGPYERMPPGYVPPARGGYDTGLVDDDDDLPPPRSYGSRPPVAGPGTALSTPPRSTYNAAPPRGGAKQPDNDGALSPPGLDVITADPDRSGMLPPPPERFPQRVAPASPPKPKPVIRAAAAAPKAAPLPKPKPGATTDAPSASAQPVWPSAPEPARAPAKSAPAEETPH